MAFRRRPDLTLDKLRKLQSPLTNGNALFLGDVRATAPRARRYADVIAGVSSDLGGRDNLSNAEKLLIARAANLNLQCEIKEQHWGEKNDHEAGPKDVHPPQRETPSMASPTVKLALIRSLYFQGRL